MTLCVCVMHNIITVAMTTLLRHIPFMAYSTYHKTTASFVWLTTVTIQGHFFRFVCVCMCDFCKDYFASTDWVVSSFKKFLNKKSCCLRFTVAKII